MSKQEDLDNPLRSKSNEKEFLFSLNLKMMPANHDLAGSNTTFSTSILSFFVVLAWRTPQLDLRTPALY